MSEGSPVRTRQNCCRLCLAPDNECISILNSYAADKEPLVTKIHNCVSIKISPTDRLSLRICHACISYLNSWQSFKNRCIASQNKQRSWLEFSKRHQIVDNNVNISSAASESIVPPLEHQNDTPEDGSNLASSILDGISSLKKRKSLTVYVSPKNKPKPLPAQQHHAKKHQAKERQKHYRQFLASCAPQQPALPPYAYTQQQTQAHRLKVLQQKHQHHSYEAQKYQSKQQRQQQSLLLNERVQKPSQLQQKQQSQQQPQQPETQSASKNVQSCAQQLRLFRRFSYNSLPAFEIKNEPVDTDDDYTTKHHDESDEMVDPTMFLERTEEEGDEAMDTSAFSYENARATVERAAAAEVKEASCRACNLKFSTRANARRHERNLHPNLFELTTSSPSNILITKPTPALATALELQRANAAAAGAKAAKAGVTPQKYRQEVVNAFNKCETGFDYEHPEKYQHYLTDEKIVFLQQNEDFLQQYQTMTCRCCNKYFSTYKNFMAHMRKKYSTLPRNLCFSCLKLNDSKALFISHLKRRNCINLYKVLHALMAKDASFAAAVTATAAAVPDKLRAKELLVNKMYECKLCPKKFRLKLEFRTHVYDEHADAQRKDTQQKQCCFCGLELDDPAERKRHYNNMDCIVSLRCVTCDAKFDNHQKFLDHVYEKHLAGFGEQMQHQQTHGGSTDNSPGKKSNTGLGGASSTDESRSSQPTATAPPKSQYFSRMPQACPICGQQYNNYNNVLRHMESKHPDQLPQTYKCVKCGIGYPRLSNLREHMVTAHAADKTRHSGFEYIVNADAVKITDGSTPNVYTGRYDYVMKDLMSITNGGSVDEDENNSESNAKKMRLDNSGSNSSSKECPFCRAIFSNNIGLSNHMRSHTAAAQNAGSANQSITSTPNSLTITATPSQPATPPAPMSQNPVHKAMFKRSLEQAADRRFRRMRCRLCQRRFSSKKSYRFHMLNDHQIRNVQFIKCKLCDAEFAYEKGLKVHMFKIHNTLLKDEMIIKQFECDICSIVYRTEEQLLNHKKTVHGNENAQADELDETLGVETGSAGADLSGISTPVSGVGGDRSMLDNSSASGPLYWYQCKYCPANFNTNKKLAIHINSHDEFDSNDYSCKDCGNVYSGRKSLWVHRYKKHPQIAEPSECVLCRKVFFDSQMLENHIPTCNRKLVTATGAAGESGATGGAVYKHKTGDDDDDETSHDGDGAITTAALGGGELEITPIPSSNLKIKLPEVACTICGLRLTDQELFAKHIQMHEMELYTDNPLAAMFDTGPADPNQFYLDRVNDNGEYACDLCSKTFTQMTALKVHRKWHFRGDSKQSQVEADSTTSLIPTQTNHQRLLGLQAVGLMPNPRPSSKSQKRKRELKCEYCPSTFISNNNLRRHIYELHKDEIGNLPEPPKIETDEYLNCRRCNVKFESKHEWIEHKVADARIMKPFGPFQWGCDLCGAYVSRKEKLINHIHNHMKEKVIIPVEQQKQGDNQTEGRRETNKTMNSSEKQESENCAKDEYEDDGIEEADDYDEEVEEDGYEDEIEDDDGEDVEDEVMNVNENANDGQNEDEDVDGDGDGDGDGEGEGDGDMEVDEEDDGDVDDTNDDESNDVKAPVVSKIRIKPVDNFAETTEAEDSPSYAGDDDDDEDDNNIDPDTDSDSDSSTEEEKAPVAKTRFSCDLCRLFFDTQQELQKHVKMHFLNGPGSVTLTEIKPKVANKSRSSSSDVVAV